MTKRIENAINILLDAYNNETLMKDSCFMCAVGNLVAATKGVNPSDRSLHDFSIYGNWYYAIRKYRYDLGDFTIEDLYAGTGRVEKGLSEIEPLGFTIEEINQIEILFESNTTIGNFAWTMSKKNRPGYRSISLEKLKADQLKGLQAVVNYLLELDEKEPEETYENTFLNRCNYVPQTINHED